MADKLYGIDRMHQGAIANQRAADRNKWDEMLAMLNFAHKGNPQTMLGFGLGRLLRDGFNTWMNNYKARDAAKTAQAWEDYQKTDRSMPFDDYKKKWYAEYDANRQMQGQTASDGLPVSINTSPSANAPDLPGKGEEGSGTPAMSQWDRYMSGRLPNEELSGASALDQYAREMWGSGVDPFGNRRYKVTGWDGQTRFFDYPVMS